MLKIYDLHCDLPTKIYSENESILHNRCQWAIDKCPAESFVQFFACYIDIDQVKNPYSYTNNVISAFKKACDGHIKIAERYNDIATNKRAAILSIEGGEALEGDIKHLEDFYNQGVRLLALTWNYENELGYSAVSSKSNMPLKPFGIKVLNKMNELNMIIDVSHLNEGGFWSVAQHSNKPYVASHSNAKRLCNNSRNLNDEQIKAIIKSGGLIGLNMYPDFLSNSGNADIKDIMKHIDYFLSLGAINSLSLGCDFDGIDKTPYGISDVSCIMKIADEMQKNNFSDEDIAKILYKNCDLLLKSVLL